jgi:preprotein translocase subunit SecA
VRESAHRVLGERPYDEQMLAGILLHRGRLVEMQTGEGKTLAAVGPVALNALTGRGVHVLTYNDYLARRDAGWMGPIYRQLGLTVSFVQEGLTTEERQRAYACDVTYLTVKEAGFDLLRDSLCLDPRGQVHRPFHLALVDEADSILIDEARIPLVIAGNLDEPKADLLRLAGIARRLERGADFATDEHARNIFLTDRGIQRAEALLGCGNLFLGENIRLQAELRNALHAETLLRRDVDYIVRDGRIELVDELTGRVAENRHWPDGLQAALEAKEGLFQQPEGKVLSSLTIQHFLRKYPRPAGPAAKGTPAHPASSSAWRTTCCNAAASSVCCRPTSCATCRRTRPSITPWSAARWRARSASSRAGTATCAAGCSAPGNCWSSSAAISRSGARRCWKGTARRVCWPSAARGGGGSSVKPTVKT